MIDTLLKFVFWCSIGKQQKCDKKNWSHYSIIWVSCYETTWHLIMRIKNIKDVKICHPFRILYHNIIETHADSDLNYFYLRNFRMPCCCVNVNYSNQNSVLLTIWDHRNIQPLLAKILWIRKTLSKNEFLFWTFQEKEQHLSKNRIKSRI